MLHGLAWLKLDCRAPTCPCCMLADPDDLGLLGCKAFLGLERWRPRAVLLSECCLMHGPMSVRVRVNLLRIYCTQALYGVVSPDLPFEQQ